MQSPRWSRRPARGALAVVFAIAATGQQPAIFVLVTIDTLRADRVGVYSGVDLTPRLDRIAREGAYAANAMTHVPLTRPPTQRSLSGLLPWEVGVRDNLAPAELPSSPLLAEILKGAGFRTGAFVSSIVLERRGGFGRGFDRYDDDFPKTQSADLLNTLQKPGAETLRAAIAWLESQRAADRIFLWVHLYEPHDPYEPPEPYASRYRDRPYDGEVAYADALVGQLDDALERLGLKSQTLLAVASDHGEGLGEHQETLHGFFVYQTTLAVPLILRGPGIVGGGRDRRQRRARRFSADGARSAGRARSTRLSALGHQPRRGAPGRHGPDARQPAVCRVAGAAASFRMERSAGAPARIVEVRAGPEARALRPCVGSARAAQPRRRAAGAGRGPSRDAREMLDQERRIGTKATAQTLPADLLERLGALGYVSGVRPRRPRRAPIRRTRSSSSGRPTKACATGFWR